MTYGAMHRCKRRILRYAQKHNALPSTLKDTVLTDGHDSSTKDGWGFDLEYRVEPNNIVTFYSLGKDHAPGGTGDNMDMTGTFLAKQPNGSWSNELVDWILDPFDNLRKQKTNQSLEHTP